MPFPVSGWDISVIMLLRKTKLWHEQSPRLLLKVGSRYRCVSDTSWGWHRARKSSGASGETTSSFGAPRSTRRATSMPPCSPRRRVGAARPTWTRVFEPPSRPNMRAVDTSVLVRLLVRDDEQQVERTDEPAITEPSGTHAPSYPPDEGGTGGCPCEGRGNLGVRFDKLNELMGRRMSQRATDRLVRSLLPIPSPYPTKSIPALDGRGGASGTTGRMIRSEKSSTMVGVKSRHWRTGASFSSRRRMRTSPNAFSTT